MTWATIHRFALTALYSLLLLGKTPGVPQGQVIRRDSSSYTVSEVPAPGTGLNRLREPFDVAIDPQNVMYLSFQTRIAKIKPDGTVLAVFGRSAFGADADVPGAFLNATGLALDVHGNLVVADSFKHQVMLFSPEGTFLGAIGSNGSGPGQLNGPCGVAVDNDGSIYVADQNNHRVQKFDERGQFIMSIARTDDKPRQPRWVALDGHGNLYVSDRAARRVDVYTTDGVFRWSLGNTSENPNLFTQPEGIAVDTRGNIYVNDAGIMKFNKTGKLLENFGRDTPQEQGLRVVRDGTVYTTRSGETCLRAFKPPRSANRQ